MSAFSDSSNHFLSSLSSDDSALLRPHLKRVEFSDGAVLHRTEDRISRVYFPETGVAFLIVDLSDGRSLSVGMFGKNDVLGVGALLDGPVALNHVILHGLGLGFIGERDALKKAVLQSETLRASLAQYEQMMFAFTQQIAACNAAHTLDERLCRWLLQMHDLLSGEELPVTQELLSEMLGVQRSSINLNAQRLQEAGLIKYGRGRIHVVDVDALHERSCDCYDVINGHFRRLIGWIPKVG